jgi:hypothetical protein
MCRRYAKMRLAGIMLLAATALALAACCCQEDWDDDDYETEPEFRSISLVPGTTLIAVGWETYPCTKAYLRLGSTANLDGTYYSDSWLDDEYVYEDFIVVHNLTPRMKYYFQIVAVTTDGVKLESDVYSAMTR